jgi:hypothetical protein
MRLLKSWLSNMFCGLLIRDFTAKKSRLKQSKKRKDSCIHYCKTHGMHYMKNCPYCYVSKTLDEAGL